MPVVIYLFIFQTLALRSSVAGAATIAASLACVVVGLMFFMEGLRVWLMPMGETIGDGLPKKSSLPTIIGFAFLVGVGATYAEPAIGALRSAGANVDPARAPLLHALLNRHAATLAAIVGVGVGAAVVLGTLRFLGNWSLRRLLVPVVAAAAVLTTWAQATPDLSSCVGLAWDFGAVIVGPITVPLVLGLGLGVCKASGRSDAGMAGFGAVTLISLFPVIATLSMALVLHYSGAGAAPAAAAPAAAPAGAFDRILGGLGGQVILTSLQAVAPLSILLFLVLMVVLRERISRGDELGIGLAFALAGLMLFNLGLLRGLTPLGDQVGSAAPAAFSQILAGEPQAPLGPLYAGPWGLVVIIAFAFFLGYGSTLAEPALGALGSQVHEVTVGAIRKTPLVHAVSFGVGIGMALGIARLLFDLPSAWLLVAVYGLLLLLTLMSTEEFASIGWDCGAVTTGPFTVPLVVAMGLGLGRSLPGVVEGFGILSLATAGPILVVLVMGLMARRRARAASVEKRAGG